MSNSNEGFNEKLKETVKMNEEELDEYFFEKSKEILSEYKLIYQKLQYGPNRGQYFVYLPMENDLSQKYLNGNGCNYAINGTGNDKEVAFRIMSRTLADCMNTLYKKGKIMIGENSVFNSLVASHSMNIIKPKRGGKYSQGEWNDIRSIFYEMFNSPPINEKKTKIIEWRTNLIESIGFGFFKKLFLTSSRFASIRDAGSNPHNFKSSYPLNSLEIYLSHKINHSNNGVLCKYGNCLFDDVTTRTFENVFQNYQEAMSYCNTMIDKELEILSNRDLYDGSISLELWNKKYSNTNIGSELKAEILRTSYGLHIEKDHDYEAAIANYLKNTGDEKKQVSPGRSGETMEEVVWAFEPADYKSVTKGMRFVMYNNNGFTTISSLGSLPIGVLESKYELAKSWTNSFISNVNFKFTHFRDLHYYKEQKDLFFQS
ncbi:MAG: hypothetical protein NVV82_00310 [Sporocytophaga sp.]|nr:hypothetical protein [Sporocytophaga sp.]